MLMRVGQMVAMLFLAWCVLAWLESHINPDAYITTEKMGYEEPPPQYVYKRWHKYTGCVLFGITALVVWLCLSMR